MSAIDDALEANQTFYRDFTRGLLPHEPSRALAVLTCMDCRIDVEDMLGLKPGEANVLRNAGALVTEDVLRSLLVSHYALGTREWMLVGHTECGMTRVDDADLRKRLVRETQADAVAPQSFLGFADVEDSVRRQVSRLRSHPWVPRDVVVRGFVYDIRTGRLAET